jgi:Deoxyhypusine synthase
VSKYNIRPLDLSGLKTVPIDRRGGKVTVDHFARPHVKGQAFLSYLDSLPRLLAADSFRSVAEAILHARAERKPIIWGFGGHVIKCGLAPILIDLMQRGFATAFATNGSGAIHDFEIAIAGQTSEDVEAVLPDGSFGSAEETGNEMNTAISDGNRYLLGMGESLGRRLDTIAKTEFAASSLLTQAYRAGVPVTVHVAIGTDTPHTHPKAEPAAIGGATHRDFRLFCSLVQQMDQGGVYINAGSAVILPEVFLKAVSVVRNLGNPLAQFTTVNCDFLQHYRPKMNVVDRPHAGAGGKGYSLTGHHEIMIPLLAATLIECEP